MLRSFGRRVPGDGNQATTAIAYALSETSFIYPITPATTMGENMDNMLAHGKKNVWGNPIKLSMLQSEGGAAGAVHGAGSVGTLCSSFTASQGLLLMIPDLYKIAGEALPAVLHVSARSVAVTGCSIYNDHGDIYAARMSGIPMICSNGVQEAHDLSAVAHLTAISSGLPMLHFFDGFRTSHEINTYEELDYDLLYSLVDHEAIRRFRARSLNPEHPKVQGPILGPEYVWQTIEGLRAPYSVLPGTVQKFMDEIGSRTGRKYKLYDYSGPADAKHVVVMMGSGSDVVDEVLRAHPDDKIGLLKVHLYRPFCADLVDAAIPKSVKSITVMDKYTDLQAAREPLFLDVASAVVNRRNVRMYGGRYGISSRDFSPNMANAIRKNIISSNPVDSFTVGLANAKGNALPVGEPTDDLSDDTKQCIFWGLGSDGTVGANKEAIKLIVDNTPLYGQAYFAYDAHKSGGVTTSHLRFGKDPISAPYYIQRADYIACHNPAYIKKFDMVKPLKKGGMFVVNLSSKLTPDSEFPASLKRALAERDAKVYTIDATQIAIDLKLPGRINMIMQTVFFDLSNVIPAPECISLLKKSIQKQYARKGREVIQKNWDMVDRALGGLKEFKYDKNAWLAAKDAPESKKEGIDYILDMTIKQLGEEVDVSDVPLFGQIPPNTARVEKRGIASQIPEWLDDKCIQCNQCSILCPHSVIRPFLLEDKDAKGMKTIKAKGKELKGLNFRIQVAPLDCTGCGVCIDVCPTKALQYVYRSGDLDKREQEFYDRCFNAPKKGHLINKFTVRGSQFQQPLLEFNGACQGCGEPAIIKLLTQLYGDRLYLANATGCSLIWSATFPWNPYCTNELGQGPAWANSLFEDNAEFGYGIFHSIEARRNSAKKLIIDLIASGEISGELKTKFDALLDVWNDDEKAIKISNELKPLLKKINNPSIKMADLISQSDVFAPKTIWIIGGDGWAYDIGYGGLDHVLASGENVKVIVMDTEVYSNTGGQCSKATQRGAVANFSSTGYSKAKKDLGAISMTYRNVYTASTCLLADPNQALKAVVEAKEYNGPALIINYSPCINHGVKKGLGTTPSHCKDLVKSGYLVLYRYDPRRVAQGKNPFQLDSKDPNYDLSPLLKGESRFAALKDLYPKEAEIKYPELLSDLKSNYEKYKDLAK